jgi:hypothetical protein
MRILFLAIAVLAAGVLFYFGNRVHAANAPGVASTEPISTAHKPLPLKSLSLPLVFEPNQGQTAAQVKYLAHGAGYGLFLTADETVIDLRRAAAKGQLSPSSVIRMRLEGANAAARISAVQPLPGKSSYYIGNDPSKWRHDIPQFGRVEYRRVYPGVDLAYYGNEGQLEYDFRVAPGAEPSRIAMSFTGASAHIAGSSANEGDSGDLILSTAYGDVHFHAPRVYQPAVPKSGNTAGKAEESVTGSFRQLADSKIGFTIGSYDRSRELIIDPTLSYSTYLGGSGTEGFVHVAVDSGLNIYLTGATNSTNFPVTNGSTLVGTQNLFISKINTLNAGTGNSQLVYSIYLGGSGTDTPAGIQVDSNFGIYVAGSTSSTNFPTTMSNAINPGPPAVPGVHGFLSKISAAQSPNTPPTLTYTLTYSTYLAGNGTDNVTGLAIDQTQQNAYVTGDTTSNNVASSSAPFPANPNGYQTSSNAAAGDPQFFASQINTSGSGPQSMLYSTYFGGGNPAGAIAVGGGIAVTPAASGVTMFFTGTTNMLPVAGASGQPAFPLLNAQQSCLNQPPGATCASPTPTSITDAFVAQINPNYPGSGVNGPSGLIYSTYLGGSATDTGLNVIVDTSDNAYVVGSTNSSNWTCTTCAASPFQAAYAGVGGNTNGYIAKIGAQVGSVYPLSYFTYLGGSGPDSVQAIQVDGNQNAYVTGNTASPNLPITTDAIQAYGGGGDAFTGLISTTLSPAGTPPAVPGDYLTYLGGSALDQGTGIVLDTYNAPYIAGNTQSSNYPVTSTAYQTTLPGPQAAFVSKIGLVSQITVTAPSTSPLPNPVAAGTQVAFVFNIVNNGPDNASNVNFYATTPILQLNGAPTAQLTAGTGSCPPVQVAVIPCYIPSLAVGGMATVQVNATPSLTVVPPPLTISVSGTASANNGPLQGSVTQTANVVDFTVQVGAPNPNPIYAGNPTKINVQFCPTIGALGYSGTITPSETSSPSMVTATTPTFDPTTVTLSGNSCGSTTLSIATVARPVNTGGLLRRSPFYATWLPIGGLSLMGLGIGATRKRRWFMGVLFCLILGIIMLLPSCGSTSVSANPTGGTLAGNYRILITGSAGTGASHQGATVLTVN